MNLGQCLEILELRSAESLADVKKAYKVLVNVWHPDRFAHDPDLKQKAESKIQEINAAYEQLEVFFTQKSYKVAPQSISEDPTQKTFAAQPDVGRHIYQTAAPGFRPAGPEAGAGPLRPAEAARSSSLGTYVFFGFLFGLAVFSVLAIHFLTRIDSSVSTVFRKTLDTIQERIAGTGQPSPSPQEDKPLGKDSLGARPAAAGTGTAGSIQAQRQCIIYLDTGDYIIAENWWYNGDMVEYRLKHGIVGIEKKRVKDIHCE